MNLGFEIRDCQDLQTVLNWSRDFTGSHESISITISSGRSGIEEIELAIELEQEVELELESNPVLFFQNI